MSATPVVPHSHQRRERTDSDRAGAAVFFSHFRGLGAVSESAVVHGAHLIELNARTHPSASSKRASTSMQKPTLHPLVPPPPPFSIKVTNFESLACFTFYSAALATSATRNVGPNGRQGGPNRRPFILIICQSGL